MHMHPFLAAAGIALLAFNLHDVVKTTLGQRGGYLTTWVTSMVWRNATRLRKHVGTHRMLSAAGIASVVLIVLIWLALLWVAWWLVFCGDRNAVLDPSGFPASFYERFQYCGYAMVTLGTPAGFEAGTALARIATVVAAGNGFAVLTLAIAYLTPLLTAATEKRQLALHISTLGETADEIVRQAWNGESCRSLEDPLGDLRPHLVLYAQRHLTYPALHYFHSTDRSSAAAPSLAALDEALTLLLHGCLDRCRVDALTLDSTRRAISAVLATLRAGYVQPASEVPPPPDLESLRRAGIPVVSARTFAESLEDLEERRRLLLALVKNDGWNWSDVRAREGEGDEEGQDEPMTEVEAEDVVPERHWS